MPPVETGIWRIDGGAPRRLTAAKLPTEKALETFLERDPSLLGRRLMVIGRQVPTAHGKFIDLLAMDADGNLHVLELKRDKTSREVVAQALDYGSWVETLERDAVLGIARRHVGEGLEAAFEETFGDSLPDEVNIEHQLTIVATELDASSERIVGYLAKRGITINVVFFAYLDDDGRQYLTHSWLIDPDESDPRVSGSAAGKRAIWNGRDWFVSFGDEAGGRSWDDARTYGFVSAGGGPFYSRTLRAIPVGARLFVHVPQRGYVAVGTSRSEAQRFDRAKVEQDGRWVRLAEQPLTGTYTHAEVITDDDAEWVIPVQWERANPKSEAFWRKGMFANQNSACKLRQEFTLEQLAQHFQLDAGV